MGFSCLLGITRVANVFTILAFVAEFMKCEISDIMTMTVSKVRLATLALDVMLTGTMIIISIGMNTAIGPLVQYLIIVVQYLVNYLGTGLGMYGILYTLLLFIGMLMKLLTTSIVIELLAIGANFHHSSRNRPPQTPVIGK